MRLPRRFAQYLADARAFGRVERTGTGPDPVTWTLPAEDPGSTDTHSNKSRESWGQGVANVLSGLFGGMGGCAVIAQTMINVKASESVGTNESSERMRRRLTGGFE